MSEERPTPEGDSAAIEELARRLLEMSGGSVERLDALVGRLSEEPPLPVMPDVPRLAADSETGEDPADPSNLVERLGARLGMDLRIELAPPELVGGRRLTDRYAVGEEELGRGGYGVVYRGQDLEVGREVALKFLHGRHRDNRGVIRRLVGEAQIAGQLTHPGIVPVYDVAESDRGVFLCMKVVRGEGLEALLRRRASPSEELPRWLGVFLQVCQAIAYAHQAGVVHRDLKPANVKVGEFGEVQVLDWGLAAGAPSEERGEGSAQDEQPGDPGEPRLTEEGAFVGTREYASPEQAAGRLDAIGRRSDVFGLGAMLCEILTGFPPYGHDERGRAMPREEILGQVFRAEQDVARKRLAAAPVDPELRTLCESCLAADPADRPADAKVVAERVEAYLRSVEQRAQDAELEARTAHLQTENERRVRRYVVGIAAMLLVGVAAVVWWVADGVVRKELDHQRARQAYARALEFRERGEWVRAVEESGLAAAALRRHSGDGTGLRAAVLQLDEELREKLHADEREDRERERRRSVSELCATVLAHAALEGDPAERTGAEWVASRKRVRETLAEVIVHEPTHPIANLWSAALYLDRGEEGDRERAAGRLDALATHADSAYLRAVADRYRRASTEENGHPALDLAGLPAPGSRLERGLAAFHEFRAKKPGRYHRAREWLGDPGFGPGPVDSGSQLIAVLVPFSRIDQFQSEDRRAEALAATGEAIAVMRRYANGRDTANAAYWEGLVQLNLGERSLALEAFEVSGSLCGDLFPALNNVAWLHLLLGNDAAARDAAQRAIELRPGMWKPHYILGMAQAGLGDLEAARQAASNMPESGDQASPARKLALESVIGLEELVADLDPGESIPEQKIRGFLDSLKRSEEELLGGSGHLSGRAGSTVTKNREAARAFLEESRFERLLAYCEQLAARSTDRGVSQPPSSEALHNLAVLSGGKDSEFRPLAEVFEALARLRRR